MSTARMLERRQDVEKDLGRQPADRDQPVSPELELNPEPRRHRNSHLAPDRLEEGGKVEEVEWAPFMSRRRWYIFTTKFK
jgi:hypothetical protein